MIRDQIGLVINSLTSKKTRSYLTLIGIFIGIAAVISLIGLGEGLRNAITGQFGFLGTDILTIQAAGLSNQGPPGSYVVNPLTTDLAAKIERLSNVKAAVNRKIKMGMVGFNDQESMAYIVNAADGSSRKLMEKALNMHAAEGRLLKDGDGRKVVIGNSFADDSTFGKAIKTGDTILINGQSFNVVGIMEKKGSFMIDGAIVMNDDAMNSLFGDDGTTSIITVQVKDQSMMEQTKLSIEKLLRKERNVKEGEEDFTVKTPQAALDSLNSTLLAVQIFVYVIAGISIVVGAIGITNTMYTSVLERTKDIGIMKSIGAKNSFIFTLFALEAGFFGMIGGIIGIILGASLAYGLSFIGGMVLGTNLIQAKISLWLMLGTLAGSFMIGIVAGLIPAYNASKMQPVEALV
jgi:putative ABC transport system permease protein